MIRHQFPRPSIPPQFINKQKTLEEKQQLIKKLKEQLDDAQNVLKCEESQLLQYEKVADSAKMVGQQASNLIVNLTAAINAANKTIARTKQASDQANGEITLQKKTVEKARETVKTINEQLHEVQRSLIEIKMVPDNINPALLVVFADNLSMIDVDSDSESGSSRVSSEPNICSLLK